MVCREPLRLPRCIDHSRFPWQALIDVYTLNELETPEPTKTVNGKSELVPHYEWEGVVCNNSKCIEKIFFENMTLTQLPKSLFNMNDLKELWLEGNQLTEIPKVTSRPRGLARARLAPVYSVRLMPGCVVTGNREGDASGDPLAQE